jgi:hypothetical protein
MVVGHSKPVFPADLPGTRVEKMGHHRTLSERLFVLLKGLHLHKENAAIAEGMVIAVTMRFLNDDLILKSGHIRRNIQNGLLISHGDTGCGSHHERRGSAGSNEGGLTSKSFGQIRSGRLEEFIEIYRSSCRELDRRPHLIRHRGS